MIMIDWTVNIQLLDLPNTQTVDAHHGAIASKQICQWALKMGFKVWNSLLMIRCHIHDEHEGRANLHEMKTQSHAGRAV